MAKGSKKKTANWPRGEQHFRAKLTDEQVREMRRRNQEDGTGYPTLHRQFHCGQSTARDICTYRTRIDA